MGNWEKKNQLLLLESNLCQVTAPLTIHEYKPINVDVFFKWIIDLRCDNTNPSEIGSEFCFFNEPLPSLKVEEGFPDDLTN